MRNALDHRVEPPSVRAESGKPPGCALRVRAANEGGMVSIEDDGRGMDPKKLRMQAVKKGIISQVDADRLTDREALAVSFRSGFSTAETVTDISGRGVGMDVVRTHQLRLVLTWWIRGAKVKVW